MKSKEMKGGNGMKAKERKLKAKKQKVCTCKHAKINSFKDDNIIIMFTIYMYIAQISM